MTYTRKRILTKVDHSEIGKLPPQAVELEEAVLGAMLLEKESIEKTISILVPEAFYKEQNGRVFNAIARLYRRSEPADILTVCAELKVTEELELVGGAYYVSSLTNRVASSANIEVHSRIVLQMYLKRELIRTGVEIVKKGYEDGEDVFDLYADAVNKLEANLSSVVKYEASSVKDAHLENMAVQLEVLREGKMPGVPSCLKRLDRVTNGWQKGELIVVAARPGMGKTAFAIGVAVEPAIQHGVPVGVFSLEMTKGQLVGRIQADRSGLDAGRIVKKQLTMDETKTMDRLCADLYTAPIYIDDTPMLTIMDLKVKARRMVKLYGVKLIIIDYLQLMSGPSDSKFGGNREQEVSGISRGLKILAKELDIPIIALSQLNRAVEKTANKMPQLSDLRESGSIEQDADMVIFLIRPEYYEGWDNYETGGKTFPSKGLLIMVIAKNRHGALAEIMLGFIDYLTKVCNYNYDTYQPEYVAPNPINKNLENTPGISTFVQGASGASATGGAALVENTGFLNEGPPPQPPDLPF